LKHTLPDECTRETIPVDPARVFVTPRRRLRAANDDNRSRRALITAERLAIVLAVAGACFVALTAVLVASVEPPRSRDVMIPLLIGPGLKAVLCLCGAAVALRAAQLQRSWAARRS
jgi:hypothetical protein